MAHHLKMGSVIIWHLPLFDLRKMICGIISVQHQCHYTPITKLEGGRYTVVFMSVCPSFVQKKSFESLNHTWNGDAKIMWKKKWLLSSRSGSQVERLYNQNVTILAVSSEPVILLQPTYVGGRSS